MLCSYFTWDRAGAFCSLFLLLVDTSYGFTSVSTNSRSTSKVINLNEHTENHISSIRYMGRRNIRLNQQKGEQEQAKWKAEFQGLSISKESNAIDIVVSFLTSDSFSTIIGFIGLIICLVNRLSTDFGSTEMLSGLQSRTDILAVVASGSVLLNGLTQLDVTSVLAEEVILEGQSYETSVSPEALDIKADIKVEERIRWSIDSLLSCTPANSAVLMSVNTNNANEEWISLARGGVLPDDRYEVVGERTPILDRFRKEDRSESYLPTLQALPGKAEFQYLPRNTQAVLILPVGEKESSSALVLGADTAKSFTPRDVAWCLSVATSIPV